ncbi:T9SS type A sorting domain-containing protein [Lacinutrix sp. Bg11-31]|uniref:T9SS type A sorting domain-containing protein n=1 Tax=Lacinutrix sp. Bg11-31 TaxID=2057808 RepID=UPI0012FD74EF|nr:T9SS type A sorting domain-containing protein [Lacinutrix sp. Bg11-31]
MKRILLLLTLVLSLSIQAQSYEFTLIQNDVAEFSVAVVPDFNSTAPHPIVNDHNFTIMLPDGATVANVSGIGTYTTGVYTNLDGAPAPGPGNDATVFNLVQDITLVAHTIGTPIVLATFDVLGPPDTGAVSLLENGALTTASQDIFKSFFIATTSGNLADGSSNGYIGQTGDVMFAYDATTLSAPTAELVGVSIFPNPAMDVVNIKGLKNDLKSIEVYNIAGQKVITAANNLETINVSELEAGVYFLNLYTENASKTIKFIKQK